MRAMMPYNRSEESRTATHNSLSAAKSSSRFSAGAGEILPARLRRVSAELLSAPIGELKSWLRAPHVPTLPGPLYHRAGQGGDRACKSEMDLLSSLQQIRSFT